MSIKRWIIRRMRSRSLQPMWERLFRLAKVGMNYWGGSSMSESGEKNALAFAHRKLGSDNVVVFDVGAYTGDYARMVMRIFRTNRGQIHCFEPSTHNFSRLQKEISHMRASNLEIHAHNLALGVTAANASLFSREHGSSTASLYETAHSSSPETVTVETLDAFCTRSQIGVIDYLKIDVEGAELDVLRGATGLVGRSAIRFVQFEFGPMHVQSRVFLKDIFELLGSNYKFYRIVRNGLRRIPRHSPDIEVFSTANYLAELTASRP